MGIYRQGTKFTIREGKLTIFQKDKKYKTDNWYGRFFIESKQVEKSSDRFKIVADKDMRKMSNIVENLIRRYVESRL